MNSWAGQARPRRPLARPLGIASFTAFALFVAMCVVPQVFLKPITGNEDISTIDIISLLIIGFIVASGRIRLEKPQIYVALFILFMLATYLILAIFDVSSFLGRLPYVGRTVSILSIVLLVPYLPRSEALFAKTGIAMSIISLAAILYMTFMYSLGSHAFDAHQTLLGQDGYLNNRLGGLPGESGAYAFNALVVTQLAFLFLVLRSRNLVIRLGALAVILFVVYTSFKFSQARIMLVNVVAFAACVYVLYPARPGTKILALIPIAALVGYVVIFGFSMEGQVLARFNNSQDDITSGRIEHWINTIDYIVQSPMTLLIGIGNRMTNVVLTHVVENFFLYFILEYGIIGLLLFMAVLFAPLRRIFRSAFRSADPTSIAFVALWVATFAQWQVNDVITYYQTFPPLIGFTCWWYSILGPSVAEEAEEQPAGTPGAGEG